jgi:hypothetical protein
MAEATIILTSSVEECCAELGMANIDPWSHELLILRDGVVAFEGPISVRPSLGDTTLVAFDAWAWVATRQAHSTIDASASPATASSWVSAVLGDAFATDDPMVLGSLDIRPIPALVGPTYKVNESNAWTDGITPLLDTVIDVTSVGRRLVVWPARTCLAYLGQISASDFIGAWSWGRTGQGFATRVVVTGADGIVATAGGSSPRYGLIERRIDKPDVTDTVTLQTIANGAISTRPPLVLSASGRDASLACTCPIIPTDIVPGCCVTVNQRGCDAVSSVVEIDSLTVTWDEHGERVALSALEPKR